jgi:hypothetical protein
VNALDRIIQIHKQVCAIGWHECAVPKADLAKLIAVAEAAQELVDLMEDVYAGNYTPDSFTTQPARLALAALTEDTE